MSNRLESIPGFLEETVSLNELDGCRPAAVLSERVSDSEGMPV